MTGPTPTDETPRFTGMSPGGRPARRQVGARLTADQYQRLKEHCLLTGRSYPGVLASAYDAYHLHLDAPTEDSFGFQEPTRLGRDSRLVQFYLDISQITLLQTLATSTGRSVAGTIRHLLGRYLAGAPLLEQEQRGGSPSQRPRFLCVSDPAWADRLKRSGHGQELVAVREGESRSSIFMASDFGFRILDYTMRTGRGRLLSQKEALELLLSAEEFASPSGSRSEALESLLSESGWAADPIPSASHIATDAV